MVTLKLICDSCGKEMNLNAKEYEDHIKENHKTKINVKSIYFNTTIWRQL